MKTISLFFTLCLLAFCQQATSFRYTGTCTATVSGSGTTVCTVQQPATGSKQVQFESVVSQCPGQAFTIDQAVGGTAASTTKGSFVNALGPGVPQPTAQANIYSASNVGNGTTIFPTLTYSSGTISYVDLSHIRMGTTGNTSNYSITLTNSGSGNCSASIVYTLTEIN